MRGQQSGAGLERWWPVSTVVTDTCKTHQLSKDKDCKVCQETAQSQDNNLPREGMGSSNLRQLSEGPHIRILSSTVVLGQQLSWRSLTLLTGTLWPFVVFVDTWYDNNDGAKQSTMPLLPSSQKWSKAWHWSGCLQTWSTHLHLLAVPHNPSLQYSGICQHWHHLHPSRAIYERQSIVTPFTFAPQRASPGTIRLLIMNST